MNIDHELATEMDWIFVFHKNEKVQADKKKTQDCFYKNEYFFTSIKLNNVSLDHFLSLHICEEHPTL